MEAHLLNKVNFVFTEDLNEDQVKSIIEQAVSRDSLKREYDVDKITIKFIASTRNGAEYTAEIYGRYSNVFVG